MSAATNDWQQRGAWDPVTGAAIAHLGLRILPGLPCPTCRGTGWRCRNSNLMCTHRVHQGCEDCTGSGVWTPPDSPVPIGVTSAEPKDGQRFASWATYCLSERWFLTPHDRVVPEPRAAHPIVLSSMIGEGTLRKVKVVEADADGHGAVVEMRPDGSLWFWPEGAFGEDAATDISSALPFLPGLKPGDTVYLLDGFTQSVRCPECEGTGWQKHARQMPARIRLASDTCHRCSIAGFRSGCLPCPFPVEDAPETPMVRIAA